MKVLLAKSAGFCWGVSRAIAKARHEAKRSEGTVFTDGPLIHNEQMMAQLREEQIIETDSPETISDCTLIIRAHGIPPVRRALLRELPSRLVDATCPDVARIQGLIRSRARKGYHTIIFGDEGHAEVTGLLGFAEGNGHVIGNVHDISQLPDMNPVCLVSQSTQLPIAFEHIADAARKRFPRIEILDTICSATRNRQHELLSLAEQVDAIVVVGGAHSANTLRLVELASSLRPTRHIQTADQIDPVTFRNYTAVGLTAGASTPDFIIEKVKKTIESI